jgi:hypothetical protein
MRKLSVFNSVSVDGYFTDKKNDIKPWQEGFSLNSPPDESNLERLPIDQIESLFGANCVVTADKQRKIQDILGGRECLRIGWRKSPRTVDGHGQRRQKGHRSKHRARASSILPPQDVHESQRQQRRRHCLPQ